MLFTGDVEAQTDAAVFDGFHKHFVVAGLIDSAFEPVIAAARQQGESVLLKRGQEVLQLLEAVDSLYCNMSDSLRFAGTGTRGTWISVWRCVRRRP